MGVWRGGQWAASLGLSTARTEWKAAEESACCVTQQLHRHVVFGLEPWFTGPNTWVETVWLNCSPSLPRKRSGRKRPQLMGGGIVLSGLSKHHQVARSGRGPVGSRRISGLLWLVAAFPRSAHAILVFPTVPLEPSHPCQIPDKVFSNTSKSSLELQALT